MSLLSKQAQSLTARDTIKLAGKEHAVVRRRIVGKDAELLLRKTDRQGVFYILIPLEHHVFIVV